MADGSAECTPNRRASYDAAATTPLGPEAADDDGPPSQLRSPQELDRDEEGVHVDVDDGAVDCAWFDGGLWRPCCHGVSQARGCYGEPERPVAGGVRRRRPVRTSRTPQPVTSANASSTMGSDILDSPA